MTTQKVAALFFSRSTELTRRIYHACCFWLLFFSEQSASIQDVGDAKRFDAWGQ